MIIWLFVSYVPCFILLPGHLSSAVIYFTLGSEANEDLPEFALTCQSRRGPVTEVEWRRDGVRLEEDSNHMTSQIIVNTSSNTVYNNTLRVRGRESGRYVCTVRNNAQDFFPDSDIQWDQTTATLVLRGKYILCKTMPILCCYICEVGLSKLCSFMLIKISLMRFLFNADGCGARKTSGTDGIATCWEWESSRSRVSRRRPHPQTNYCRPQRRQWQSRHKHSTWSSRVTVPRAPRVYYSRKITHYAGIMPNAV